MITQSNISVNEGGGLKDISDFMPDIQKCHPDVIFLQIGGNDISLKFENGLDVAAAMLELANLLVHNTACRRVYIGQLYILVNL